LIVGAYLLWRAHQQRRSPLLLVGLTSILVGVGSFLFHSSGTFVGELFDLGGMYLIGSLMVTMEVRRFVKLPLSRLVMCFFGISAVSMLLVIAFRTVGIIVFGVQVAMVYASNIYWRWLARRRRASAFWASRNVPSTNHRAAYWLGGTFLFALGIWTLDLTGVVCAPNNHIFTGHSVWHILTAVCLIFFFRHQEQFVTPHALQTVIPPVRHSPQ
jgi:hypothetical protein